MEDLLEKTRELYKLYGFNCEQRERDFYIFTYSNGYFNNAEIVTFGEKKLENNDIKQKYEELGYSVRNIKCETYEEIHSRLFNGFFDIRRVDAKLKNQYEAFCDLQSKKLLDTKYEYVMPVYSWNKEKRKENLSRTIIKQLDESGAQLIILEAAAGYGKTCTSYELINSMCRGDNNKKTPIFTELSKNRKAALFRYVLLDEIDRNFSTLSSNLVLYEIEQGNVPLIIDGFDELLSRSNKNMLQNSENQDEEVQTMLDTIAELFVEGSQCKVVLTSRKSSIFTGEIFTEWAGEKLKNCTITRVSISEPTISDWLGSEKTQLLEDKNIPFASIINPILLAYMRSMDMETFKKNCENVEMVITRYFEALLEREKERQALVLSVSEQYNLLKKLAKEFVDFEIKSEEMSFIRDLFMDIIHSDFQEYRERYFSVEEKPSEQEFATKLAGHALLNRISSMKNDIGFINDFIFGIFIGENIIDNSSMMRKIGIEYIDIACTAFASRGEEKKEELYKIVSKYLSRLHIEQQFSIQIELTSTIQQNYNKQYIRNFSFGKDVYFDGTYRFSQCIFLNCTFTQTVIMTSAFYNCTFNNCKFYNNVIIRDTEKNCKLIFDGNCIGDDKFAQHASYEKVIEIETDYEKVILRKFWPEGERYSKGQVKEIVLLKSNSREERMTLTDSLASLKTKGLLKKEGHYWYINKSKIREIKDILEK